jgi:hypothetical protein
VSHGREDQVNGEIAGVSGAPMVQNDVDCAKATLPLVSDAVPVAELVTRVGGYMARRTRLVGCAAKPIIDHHEGRLEHEYLYSDDSSHAVR